MPPTRRKEDDGKRSRPNTTPLPISSSIPISRPPLSPPPKTSLSNPRSNNPRFRRVKVEEEIVGNIVPSKENYEKEKSFEDEFLRLVGLVFCLFSFCNLCDFIG